MLLFQPEHVLPILRGDKTQTRREWPRGPRVKVGALHQCRLRMLRKDTTFAVVLVTGLRRERLCEITDEDARREGYESRAAYFEVYGRIYSDVQQHDPRLVYVVDFKAVKVPCFSCEASKVVCLPGGKPEPCWLCDDDGFVDLTDRYRIGAVERWRRSTMLPLGVYR